MFMQQPYVQFPLTIQEADEQEAAVSMLVRNDGEICQPKRFGFQRDEKLLS